jgi:hypothetical protein
MSASGSRGNHLASANLTGKHIIAGMGFKITLIILPALIFSVHAIYPPKSKYLPFGRNAEFYLSQTSRFATLS